MSPLEPRKLLDMPIDEVLKFYPSMELDVFIFEKVLQGPFDVIEETKSLRMLPEFSRKFADCYPLLIMAGMSSPKLSISVDEGAFYEAVRRGQLVRKNEIKTWKVESDEYVGYGRTFPEAICKFMICRTFEVKKNAKTP